MDKGATLSPCGAYRYELWRVWDKDLPYAVWVMLNPSTADADQDDPTLRRCIGFAKTWGLGGVGLVNLYAARSTNPDVLSSMEDPVGPENDDYILAAVKNRVHRPVVVCGWGSHQMARRGGRDWDVRNIIRRAGGAAECLGITKEGFPRHPLYLSGLTPRVLYR